MKRYWRLGAAFLACLLALPTYYGSLLSQSDREVERKIIEYLKANLKAGQPVIVSKLHNEVFTSPEERKALDRLYNIFFKVPAYIAEYYASSHKPPTLAEITHQFNLPIEGEADVILKIIEYDRRVPRFLTRDARTGEIAQVDIEKVKADPRFNKVIERTIAGWEGKVAPPFSVQALDGKALNSSDLKGKPHLVYFWFTHCPPCVQITPHLVSLQRKFASPNLYGSRAQRGQDSRARVRGFRTESLLGEAQDQLPHRTPVSCGTGGLRRRAALPDSVSRGQGWSDSRALCELQGRGHTSAGD